MTAAPDQGTTAATLRAQSPSAGLPHTSAVQPSPLSRRLRCLL